MISDNTLPLHDNIIQAGAQKLKTIFTDLSELPGHGSVDALVTQQPLLLVEDVDELLGEIQRSVQRHTLLF